MILLWHKNSGHGGFYQVFFLSHGYFNHRNISALIKEAPELNFKALNAIRNVIFGFFFLNQQYSIDILLLFSLKIISPQYETTFLNLPFAQRFYVSGSSSFLFTYLLRFPQRNREPYYRFIKMLEVTQTQPDRFPRVFIIPHSLQEVLFRGINRLNLICKWRDYVGSFSARLSHLLSGNKMNSMLRCRFMYHMAHHLSLSTCGAEKMTVFFPRFVHLCQFHS